MTQLTIHLLGQFQVLLNGKAITHFATDKVRALLTYLAIENQYPHRREKLATLFWPEKSESIARANLRRALGDLRANIQDQIADPPFLWVTHHDIQLNLDGQIEIDCQLLSEYADNGCENPQDVEQCNRLLDLYQGDFLEGFSLSGCADFDKWQTQLREQYNRKMTGLLDQVIQYLTKQEQYENALPYCRRLVALSPWLEEPRRKLMRILTLAGYQEQALQQYDDLKIMLSEELGLDPEPATTQLMKRIRISDNDFHRSSDSTSMPDVLPKEIDEPTEIQETFAGRTQELADLHRKMTNILKSQTGSVHFLVGEAGSGKTWLGREFIFQAIEKQKNLVAAAGFCNAFTGSGDPYLPFREILSQLCGEFSSQLRGGTITRTYARRLWSMRNETAKIVLKYGRGLVGTIIPSYVFLNERNFHRFQLEDWYQELKTIAQELQSNVNAIQYSLLLSQLTTVLQKIAEISPMILAIDDLHWADVGTLNLLMHLGKHLAGYPILLLCAYRPEEVFITPGGDHHPLQPILNELQRDHGKIFTKLNELSGRKFIQDVLNSEPNNLPADYAEYLYKITAGHALSVRELLRTFQENGSLMKDDQGRWIENNGRVFEHVPPKIEGILALRIQKLPQLVQHYLSLGSVQGEIFNAEIISQITGHKTKKVLQLLSIATHDHHLIQPQYKISNERANFTVYQFHHILYQKYLYDRLEVNERMQMHEQVGTVLEELTSDDPDSYAVQLARHFREAGRLKQAIPYYMQAAKRAQRMVGYQEATSLFETALNLLLQLPESPERDQEELMLQIELSLVYQMIHGMGHEKITSANERAWELCQTVGTDEQSLDVLEILCTQPAGCADFERWDEIETLRKKIWSKMKVLPLREKIRQGLSEGWMDFRFGRFHSSVQNGKKAVHAYYETRNSENEEVGEKTKIGCLFMDSNINVEIGCLRLDTLASCILGDFQQVVENRNKISQITKTLTDKYAIIFGIMTVTRINRRLREYERCEPLLNQFQELTGEDYYHFPQYELFGKWIKGFIHLHRQEFDNAIETFTQMTEKAQKIKVDSAMNLNYQAMAEAYQKKGDLAKAKQWLDKALAQQKKTSETLHLSLLSRFQGNIFRLEGNFSAAEEKYLEAIQIAQQQSAKTFELYAVEELCRLWLQQGKTEQAHARLSEMITQFDGQPDVGILREANALLQTFQVEPHVQ